MGYELEKLKNQMGISNETLQYSGTLAPAPLKDTATAAEKTAYSDQLAKFQEDQRLYDQYKNIYQSRLGSTDIYRPAQNRELLQGPVYSGADLALKPSTKRTVSTMAPSSEVLPELVSKYAKASGTPSSSPSTSTPSSTLNKQQAYDKWLADTRAKQIEIAKPLYESAMHGYGYKENNWTADNEQDIIDWINRGGTVTSPYGGKMATVTKTPQFTEYTQQFTPWQQMNPFGVGDYAFAAKGGHINLHSLAKKYADGGPVKTTAAMYQAWNADPDKAAADAAMGKGDWDTAAALWKKAAANGNANAQASLGVAYAMGKGTDRNDVEAAKWMMIAEKNGYGDTGKNSNYYWLSQRMTPGQIEAAKSAMNNYFNPKSDTNTGATPVSPPKQEPAPATSTVVPATATPVSQVKAVTPDFSTLPTPPPKATADLGTNTAVAEKPIKSSVSDINADIGGVTVAPPTQISNIGSNFNNVNTAPIIQPTKSIANLGGYTVKPASSTASLGSGTFKPTDAVSPITTALNVNMAKAQAANEAAPAMGYNTAALQNKTTGNSNAYDPVVAAMKNQSTGAMSVGSALENPLANLFSAYTKNAGFAEGGDVQALHNKYAVGGYVTASQAYAGAPLMRYYNSTTGRTYTKEVNDSSNRSAPVRVSAPVEPTPQPTPQPTPEPTPQPQQPTGPTPEELAAKAAAEAEARRVAEAEAAKQAALQQQQAQLAAIEEQKRQAAAAEAERQRQAAEQAERERQAAAEAQRQREEAVARQEAEAKARAEADARAKAEAEAREAARQEEAAKAEAAARAEYATHGTKIEDGKLNVDLSAPEIVDVHAPKLGEGYYPALTPTTGRASLNDPVVNAIRDMQTGKMDVPNAELNPLLDMYGKYLKDSNQVISNRAEHQWEADLNNYIRSLEQLGIYSEEKVQQWKDSHKLGEGKYHYAHGGRVKTRYADGDLVDLNPDDEETTSTFSVEPSGYDALLSKYKDVDATELAKARALSRARQQSMIDDLNAYKVAQETAKKDKSEMYWRLAQAFLTPGKTGSFGDSLANVGATMADYAKEQSAQRRADAANMLQLGLKQKELMANMADEDLKTLETQQAKTDAARQAIELAKIKASATPASSISEYAKVAQALGLTPGTPEFQAKVQELWNEAHRPPASASGNLYSEDAVTDLAQRYIAGDASALTGLGRSTGAMARIQNKVSELLRASGASPQDITAAQQNLKSQQRLLQNFSSSTPSSQGGQVLAMNTLVGHVNTLTKAAEALQRGDVALFNSLKTMWQEQTNQPLPNNLGLISQLVGDELQKAAVGGAGGVEERKDLKAKLYSPGANYNVIKEAADYANHLAAQRIKSLKQQWTAVKLPEEQFNDYLTEDTKSLLSAHTSALTTKQQQAIDWLKKNPNDPQAAAVRATLTKQGVTF